MHADVIRGLPANGTNNANAIADRYFQLTSPLLQVWLFWLGFCMMYFHPACPLGSEKTLQALFCSLAIITNMPWNYQPDQFSSLFSWPTNQRTRGLLWSTAWALISKPYFDCRINIFWVSLFVCMYDIKFLSACCCSDSQYSWTISDNFNCSILSWGASNNACG